MKTTESEINAAFLASGTGSTVEQVVQAWLRGEFENLAPAVIIVSTPQAAILRKIEEQKWNIPYHVIRPTSPTFGKDLLDIFVHYRVDMVSQNGWLAYTPDEVTHYLKDRIGNQHPGKIPEFGGHLMYGTAVLAAHDIFNRLTGLNLPAYATYHHAISGYDTGALISIKKMQLPAYDKVWTIAELENEKNMLKNKATELHRQLLPTEYENVLEVMRYVDTHGEFPSFKGESEAIPLHFHNQLQQAKQLAVTIFHSKK